MTEIKMSDEERIQIFSNLLPNYVIKLFEDLKFILIYTKSEIKTDDDGVIRPIDSPKKFDENFENGIKRLNQTHSTISYGINVINEAYDRLKNQ